jgi:hypothetical protein
MYNKANKTNEKMLDLLKQLQQAGPNLTPKLQSEINIYTAMFTQAMTAASGVWSDLKQAMQQLIQKL